MVAAMSCGRPKPGSVCAVRRCLFKWSERPPLLTLSQQGIEAEGSLSR